MWFDKLLDRKAPGLRGLLLVVVLALVGAVLVLIDHAPVWACAVVVNVAPPMVKVMVAPGEAVPSMVGVAEFVRAPELIVAGVWD